MIVTVGRENRWSRIGRVERIYLIAVR